MNNQNPIPLTIDNFKVHLILGEGLQAQVFLCTNLNSQQVVCIKLYGDGQQNFQSYEREVKMLKKLAHQNIIEIKSYNPLGCVEYQDNIRRIRPLIVLQFAYYGDLFSIVFYKQGLSEGTAKFLFKQIIMALKELQQVQISHRDLKLQNILLTSDFKVKFIDFGLSSQLHLKIDEKDPSRNYGTTYTKAPEIYRSEYICDKIDIFACGVVLYSMLFGRLPFSCATYSNKQYNLIHSGKNQQFWKHHAIKNKRKRSPLFANHQFKDLMIKIFSKDCQSRPTIADLLSNEWLMKDISSKQEASMELTQIFEYTLDQKRKQEYKLINILLQNQKVTELSPQKQPNYKL